MAYGNDLKNWKDIEKDNDFDSNLQTTDPKTLVVAYFFSPKCPNCKTLTPQVEDMAANYSTAFFLKVNVHKCVKTTSFYDVETPATFVLLRDHMILTKVDEKGAEELEDFIKKYHSSASKDLFNHIDQKKFKCFNEKGEIVASNYILDRKKTGRKMSTDTLHNIIESGLKSWLIINIPFLQPVSTEAVVIRGPSDIGPKTVLVFVNQANNPADIKAFMDRTPNERMELDEMDLDGTQYELHLKNTDSYRSVNHLTVVVQDNQSQSGVTQMSYLAVIGKPV
jgi:thiol-disulfide isomerase/thioredoxin